MPNEHYTLQIFGARKADTVKDLITSNNMDNNAKIYHTYFQNNDWFVLVYGDFNSPSDALAAIGNLPGPIQNLKPWVKPISTVKVGIRAAIK